MISAHPLLIASDIFRISRHAPGHPLAIPRVSLAVDLCRALGWLPHTAYREAPRASIAELAGFHTPEYIAAVMRAEAAQALTDGERLRFNLGINGNPIYGEVFRRPATACGASLLAAGMLSHGGIIYNPAGGTHHGQPARASGYCIFNDPVLAILKMLRIGLGRVFYLDLDAHFGDAVQQAFHDDNRVFILSVHEAGRWPMARDGDPHHGFGGSRDRAGGTARNLPVPPGLNDSEMEMLVEDAILPLIVHFAPEAIIVQGGADGLADDLMTKLELSNQALWRAVASVKPLAPRLLVLGGGGYNPYATGRCWAGIWATLNGWAVPERLSESAEKILRDVRWRHRLGREPAKRWLTTLADPPRPGPVRSEVRRLAALARAP
jgi:acetoin utilization protein AcuC